MSANETHEEEMVSGPHYLGLVPGCAKCAKQTREFTSEHEAGIKAGRSYGASNVHLGRNDGFRPQCPLCIVEHQRFCDHDEAEYWGAKK